MKCNVQDCNKNVYAKLHCNRHYTQIRKFGKVAPSTRDKRPSILKDDYAKAYDAKAKELYGEFAYLNFNEIKE